MKFTFVKRKTAPQPAHRKPAAKRVLHFDTHMDLMQKDAKAFDVVKSGDVVTDYQNVKIRGYLSTFQSTTPTDRDGDFVKPGAFKESIPTFMRNPILLVNHRNDVQSIAGGFDVVREDAKGLYVEATLSNSPVEWMKDVRWKVAEGYLRTLSMGGFFFYDETGRGIEKVSLYEGSLTPIPSNPDATFSTRELTEHESKRAQSELGW